MGQARDNDRERFDLRHKWARKIPTLSDGSKGESGFRPEFQRWCEARESFNSIEV